MTGRKIVGNGFPPVEAKVKFSFLDDDERLEIEGEHTMSSVYIPNLKNPMELAVRIWLAIQLEESAANRKAK